MESITFLWKLKDAFNQLASAGMNYIYNLHQNEKAATLSEDFDKFAIKNAYSPIMANHVYQIPYMCLHSESEWLGRKICF